MNKRLGPNYLPKRPYPYRKELQEVAKHHDYLYRTCDVSRYTADLLFLKGGLKVSKDWKMKTTVRVYRTLVRLFGRISYGKF